MGLNIKNENKEYVENILLFFPIILILSQVCYPIRGICNSVVQIIFFLLWVMLLCIYKREFVLFALKKNALIIIFGMYIGVRVMFSGRIEYIVYSPLLYGIKLYHLVVFYFIFLYLMEVDLKIKKRILNIVLLSFCISNIISIIYVFTVNRDAIRAGLSNIYFACGDYELANANVFLFSVLLYCILKKKYLTNIFLTITALITCAVMVAVSNLMTSIIMLIVALVVAIYFSRNNQVYKLILFFAVSFILIFIFRNTIANILFFLGENHFISEYMGVKMINIANILNGATEGVGTLGSRITQISLSISTFLSYPLFGVPFFLFGQETIGYHDQWFSDLATVGIFGIIIIILILHNIKKNLAYYSNNCKTISIAFTMLVIMGFFNPDFLGAIFVVIFVVSPLIINKETKTINRNIHSYDDVTSELLINNCDEGKKDLSFVIPTYNRSTYLRETIDSIISQSTKLKYEIIIVDNHSEDIELKDKINILRQIHDVKLYRNTENIGMFGNINRAISLASSDLVALLHDDDLLKDNYFFEIEKYIDKKYDILYGAHDFVGEKMVQKNALENLVSKLTLFRLIYRQNFQYINNKEILYSRRNIYGPPTCGMIIRKEVWKSLGGFDEHFYPSSDFKLFVEVAQSNKILRVNKLVSSYRMEVNESLNIKTKISTSLQAIKVYEHLGKCYHSTYYKIFRDCYIYNISKRFLENEDFIFELNKMGIKIKKPSQIKNLLYNIFRLSYFYINNLD